MLRWPIWKIRKIVEMTRRHELEEQEIIRITLISCKRGMGDQLWDLYEVEGWATKLDAPHLQWMDKKNPCLLEGDVGVLACLCLGSVESRRKCVPWEVSMRLALNVDFFFCQNPYYYGLKLKTKVLSGFECFWTPSKIKDKSLEELVITSGFNEILQIKFLCIWADNKNHKIYAEACARTSKNTKL